MGRRTQGRARGGAAMMSTGATVHLTASEFRVQLAITNPGDWFVYCTGYLARDIGISENPENAELRQLGKLAHDAEESGLVCLAQRRLAPFCFEYLAFRRPEPKRHIVIRRARRTCRTLHPLIFAIAVSSLPKG